MSNQKTNHHDLSGSLVLVPRDFLESLAKNQQRILEQLKVNQYLKEIARLVGIDESKNLTHHVARHTCAATILLIRGVPLEVVSKWLGHTNY